MNSPTFWFGGKGLMTAKLVPMVQVDCEVYCEPFAGGASVYFAKKPMGLEVLNDLDKGVISFYRLLQNPNQFSRLHRWVSLTPYSREHYYHCRNTWQDEKDPFIKVYKWFVARRQSFSGEGLPGTSWSLGITRSAKGMASKPAAFMSMVKALPNVHKRMQNTIIESMDFRDVIKKYDSPTTFFYMDPPYILGTRSSGSYRHELSLDDHKDLVSILNDIRGRVLLSCYDHEVYQQLNLVGWKKRAWHTSAMSAGRTRMSQIQGKGAATESQPRIETVFYNYKYFA
jgi:DNA adenine methylase